MPKKGVGFLNAANQSLQSIMPFLLQERQQKQKQNELKKRREASVTDLLNLYPGVDPVSAQSYVNLASAGMTPPMSALQTEGVGSMMAVENFLNDIDDPEERDFVKGFMGAGGDVNRVFNYLSGNRQERKTIREIDSLYQKAKGATTMTPDAIKLSVALNKAWGAQTAREFLQSNVPAFRIRAAEDIMVDGALSVLQKGGVIADLGPMQRGALLDRGYSLNEINWIADHKEVNYKTVADIGQSMYDVKRGAVFGPLQSVEDAVAGWMQDNAKDAKGFEITDGQRKFLDTYYNKQTGQIKEGVIFQQGIEAYGPRIEQLEALEATQNLNLQPADKNFVLGILNDLLRIPENEIGTNTWAAVAEELKQLPNFGVKDMQKLLKQVR